ncbi:hypothetical protein [Helicobacter cinaedi]|uniref:hypothetical protein n=1 Tax=Helicobacter cinaedi TaxID=213 RepID=UPI001E5E0947|nr:hypothetical protein [Helicobacter cinaedi]
MVFDFGIEISVGLVVFLIACAFVAGFVDSIAGGGGNDNYPCLALCWNPTASSFGDK